MRHGGPRLYSFCVLPPILELPSLAPQGHAQAGGRKGRGRESVSVSVSSAAVVVRDRCSLWLRRGCQLSLVGGRGTLGTLITGECVPKTSMKGVHWRLPFPGPLQPLSVKVTRRQALSHEGLCQDGLQLDPFRSLHLKLLGEQQEYPCISHEPVADASPTTFVTWRLSGLSSSQSPGDPSLVLQEVAK